MANLVNGVSGLENNEGETSRPPCVGISLNVNTFNGAIGTEVSSQLH